MAGLAGTLGSFKEQRYSPEKSWGQIEKDPKPDLLLGLEDTLVLWD